MSDDQVNQTPAPTRRSAAGNIRNAVIIWLAFSIVFELIFWLLSTQFIAWQILPPGAGDRSDEINSVMWLFTAASIPVFFLVVVFAFYSANKWGSRARPRAEGPAMLVSSRFISWWVVISVLLAGFLYVYGLAFLSQVDAKPASAPMQVNVTGEQWLWDYTYPQYGNVGGSELELVVNKPTTFTINAIDVQHSFWIPAFDIKQDAVPGETTTISVTPTKLGNYQVRCAELCGVYHSYMETPVHVVTQDEFNTWVAKQLPGAAPTAPPTSLVPLQAGTTASIWKPEQAVAGRAEG
ncbi:MAG: cytochrome c oxidase subunit II [Ktedonobacterales bacterium]